MKIGADPELFLHNGAEYIPSCGLIGGSKVEPRDMGNGYALQEDNVTVEYNIPACETVYEWLAAHAHAYNLIKETVPDLRLVAKAVAEFNPQWFEKFPHLMESGCMEDLSVYTYEPSCPAGSLGNSYRMAGGHVHVSGDFEVSDIPEITKLMDLFLAVPFARMEQDGRRRSLYGQAGVVRIKPYGFEYRTLSGAWTRHHKWQKYVWDATQYCMKMFKEKQEILPPDEVLMAAANDRNMSVIRDLFKKYQPHYKEIVNA